MSLNVQESLHLHSSSRFLLMHKISKNKNGSSSHQLDLIYAFSRPPTGPKYAGQQNKYLELHLLTLFPSYNRAPPKETQTVYS